MNKPKKQEQWRIGVGIIFCIPAIVLFVMARIAWIDGGSLDSRGVAVISLLTATALMAVGINHILKGCNQ